jgi:hypothetical protein
MSTMRYSGSLSIRITYLEPWGAGTPAPAGRSTRINGEYRCFIRSIDKNAQGVTIHVGAPAVLSHAVDSPEAFDDAAHAALSLALAEGWPVAECALTKADGSGWAITRKRDAFGNFTRRAV